MNKAALSSMPPIHGIVLAGGRSSRMGADKALLSVGGVPLLVRVVDSMALFCRGVTVVVPASDPLRYADLLDPSVQLAADRYPDKGPLAGIHAGLQAMPDPCDYGFVMACDMPVLSEELLHRMLQEAFTSAPVPEAVLCPGQPMHALYHRSAAAAAEQLLAADRLRLLGLAESVRTAYVEPPAVDCFLNLNTPADYEAYLRNFDA